MRTAKLTNFLLRSKFFYFCFTHRPQPLEWDLSWVPPTHLQLLVHLMATPPTSLHTSHSRARDNDTIVLDSCHVYFISVP